MQSHSYSQTNRTDKPIFYSTSPYIGKFQVHTKSLYPYNDTHPYGIEFEMSQLLLKENIRHNFGTFIKWGVGLGYTNFNHPDLGYAISSLAYVEPFIKSQEQWRFSLKFGTGIAYMSNPFDELNNHQNLTYSTHFAFPVYAGASAYYFFSKQWAIKANVSYNHLSNGGIKHPNLGINYPAIALGIEHSLHTYTIPPKQKLKQFDKVKRFDLLLGYSLKEDTTNTNKQHVVTVTSNYSIQLTRFNAITFSTIVEFQQLINTNSPIDQWSIAPLVGNEFLIGQLLFGQQFGVYVLCGNDVNKPILQNYYLRYNYDNRIITGVNLKSHGFNADYLSFQIGLIF